MNRSKTVYRSLTASALTCCTVGLAEANKPNVLVILADDLGYQDVGFTGCTDFETPHIDRLAREGMEFTRGYASHPYCGPSRAGLMTGRYQHRFGFETNPAYAPTDTRAGLPFDQVTIANLMKKGGYKTGAIGKWHLGATTKHHPLNRGFDYFFGMFGGGHDYFSSDSFKMDSDYFHPLIYNHGFANVEGYLTHQLTDKALEFIDQSQNDPFFLYLAYNAPHSPWEAPQETIDALSHIKDLKRRTYGAMVVEMDKEIGRVLWDLEQKGLSQDTLIFFLSDNGGPLPGVVTDNGPLRGGKGTMYEGGAHVPFVAYWPGTIKPGEKFTYPVISLDLAPTAATLAGVEYKNMDGKNLLPYLTGKKNDAPHQNIFFRGGGGNAWAIINQNGLKLTKPSWNAKQLEYYNLANDGSEKNNINTPEHAASVKKMQQDWNEWNKGNIAPQFWGHPEHTKKLKEFYNQQSN